MIALYSDKTTTIDVVFTVAGGLVTDGFTATVKLNGKVYSIPSVSAGSFKVEIPSSDFSGRTDGSYFEIIVTVADGSGKEVLKLKEMGVLEKSTAQYVANTSNELRAFLQPEFKVPNIGPDGSGSGGGGGVAGNKSNGYELYEPSSTDGLYLLKNNAINKIVAQTSDTIYLKFPDPESSIGRDFVVKVVVSSEEPPSVVFLKNDKDESIGFEAEDESWADLELGINYYSFTETER